MKKKNIYQYITLLIITCIIFIFFLSGHYATDTYNIMNVGYENYAINWSLNDGRIIMFIIRDDCRKTESSNYGICNFNIIFST